MHLLSASIVLKGKDADWPDFWAINTVMYLHLMTLRNEWMKPSLQEALSNSLQTRCIISEAFERSCRATDRLPDWFLFFPPGGNLSLSQIRSADIFSALPLPLCMFGWACSTSKASEDESRERGAEENVPRSVADGAAECIWETSCSAEEASNWICWRKTGVLS